MDSRPPAMRRRRAIAPTHEAVQAAIAESRSRGPQKPSGRLSVVMGAAMLGILSTLAIPGSSTPNVDDVHTGFEEDEYQFAQPLTADFELTRYEGTRTAHLQMLLVFSLRTGPADALDIAREAMQKRIEFAERHAQIWLQDWAQEQNRTAVFETAYAVDGFDALTQELDRILFPGGEAKLRRLHIVSLKFR